MHSAICSYNSIRAAFGKEILQTDAWGKLHDFVTCTLLRHQLIIKNHFQNKQNFEGMMYALFFFLTMKCTARQKSRKLETFYSSCNYKHLQMQNLGKAP